METTYRHRQRATLISVALLAVILVYAVLTLTRPAGAALLPSLALLTLVQLAFSSLTVAVDARALSVRYGVGWIGFAFPLSEIRDAQPVTNPWYWGWGIRLTPRGWLFNVSGRDAVEVTFASGRRVRIGTDEPEALAAAIRTSLR